MVFDILALLSAERPANNLPFQSPTDCLPLTARSPIRRPLGNHETFGRSAKTRKNIPDGQRAISGYNQSCFRKIQRHAVLAAKTGDGTSGEHTCPDGKEISKHRTVQELQAEKVVIDSSILDLHTAIDKATNLGLVSQASTALVTLQTQLQADVMILKDEVESYRDIDPWEMDKRREATALMKTKAERWTNNIELLESWLARTFSMDPTQLDWLRRECYGAEFVDGEGLKEL